MEGASAVVIVVVIILVLLLLFLAFWSGKKTCETNCYSSDFTDYSVKTKKKCASSTGKKINASAFSSSPKYFSSKKPNGKYTNADSDSKVYSSKKSNGSSKYVDPDSDSKIFASKKSNGSSKQTDPDSDSKIFASKKSNGSSNFDSNSKKPNGKYTDTDTDSKVFASKKPNDSSKYINSDSKVSGYTTSVNDTSLNGGDDSHIDVNMGGDISALMSEIYSRKKDKDTDRGPSKKKSNSDTIYIEDAKRYLNKM